MMKKTFFILLFFISSCGYQPIYLNKTLKDFEFKKITLGGDDNINKKIMNILSIKENNEGDNKNELFISSSLNIKEVSRDSSGQIKLYKNIMTVKLEIKNSNNEIIQNKNFIKEFTYNNKQNKFDLVEYQSSIKNDLTYKIISDINIFFNTK